MKKTITIPHLRDYKVTFTDKGVARSHQATTRWLNKHDGIVVSIPTPIKRRPELLVHELIHVINHIVRDMDADLNFEQEHMAYIAEWLFVEAMKL
jgi:hypothetical protein